MSASHRFLEHVGEVGLELEASSLPELFVEAGLALAELFSEEPEPGQGEIRRCVVRAPDLPALLVAWLNELIFLSETTHEVFGELHVRELGERELVAELRGAPASELRTAVKAATLHDLHLEQTEHGCRARLVLDV